MTALPDIAKQTAEIDEFLKDLEKPATTPATARLIFALDATASREPTWETACQVTGEMFEATTALGPLEISLLFYRGYSECKASRWMFTATELHRAMRWVRCQGGHTQIGRVFDHAIRETQKAKLGALIFVGDALEEPPDPLCHKAGELGKLGVPVFLLHEGYDPQVARVFKQIADLSHGAYLPFDLNSIGLLKTLLGGIAVFATGGRQALEAWGKDKGAAVLQLTSQLGR